MTSLHPNTLVVRRTLIVIATVLVGLVVAGLAFTSAPWKKEKSSRTDSGPAPASADPAAIPPIDAEIPADLETATFALG